MRLQNLVYEFICTLNCKNKICFEFWSQLVSSSNNLLYVTIHEPPINVILQQIYMWNIEFKHTEVKMPHILMIFLVSFLLRFFK